MSSWSTTIHGNNVSIERAFLPLQHAIVRLGYELAGVTEGKRLNFKRRTESMMAWDNHRRAHNLVLKFKEKSRGFFKRVDYLEVNVAFDDWDLMVSDGAQRAWQELANKLQVMLSDPAVFLPLAPPPPPNVPRPIAQPSAPHYQYQHPTFQPGSVVWVRWTDGRHFQARIHAFDGNLATVVFSDGKSAVVYANMLQPYTQAPQQVVVQSERVIERQVVVMHCRFCNELTPVDLTSCRSCGAKVR